MCVWKSVLSHALACTQYLAYSVTRQTDGRTKSCVCCRVSFPFFSSLGIFHKTFVVFHLFRKRETGWGKCGEALYCRHAFTYVSVCVTLSGI